MSAAAVAAAEAAALEGTALDDPHARAALHARVAEVVGGSWWTACGPPVTLVTPRRTARSSTARARDGVAAVEIRLTDEQLTVATVAHELAHALAGVGEGHGSRFRTAYVDVVALLAGAAAADRLRDAFTTFGVPAGQRAWPAPWRAEGSTFRVVP